MKVVNPSVRFQQIELRRTSCYGDCPVYSLLIYNTGRVVYQGDEYVKTIGSLEWLIDSFIIDQLNHLIVKYNYFSFTAKSDEELNFQITDMPSCITKIILEDGEQKVINNYSGEDRYPDSLTQFEKDIENLLLIHTII